MRQYGVDNKPRFTIKYPDGTCERYGTCDPNDDDRASIIEEDGHYYLAKHKKNGATIKYFLVLGTLVTNGFYDHEHTGWLSPKEFIEQASKEC